MFDFGKFISDIGTGVDNFFNPKKKKEEQIRVNQAQPQQIKIGQARQQPGLTLPGQQQPQQQKQPQLEAPSFNNRFEAQNPMPVQQKQPELKPVAPVNRVTPQGTVLDTRPVPARVPNDDFEKANRALKYSSVVSDKNNYIKSDADKLREELQKPNPNKQMIQGLTQSVKNRTNERAVASVDEDKIKGAVDIIGSIPGELLKATGTVGVNIAQGVARIPETVVRSAILEPLVGNATARPGKEISTASAENTGIREFLYGKDGVKSYQEQARDAQKAGKEFKKSDNGFVKTAGDLLDTPFAPFIAPAMAALDLSGVAKAGLPGTKAAVDAVVKQVEKQAGKKLSQKQAEIISKRISGEVAQSATDAVTSPVYTPKQAVGGDVLRELDDLNKTRESLGANFKINNPDNAETNNPGAPMQPYTGNGVIQTVNPITGEKKFIKPTDAEYPAAKKAIDDARIENGDQAPLAGARDENGNVLHITDRTPESMVQRGFVDETVPTTAGKSFTKASDALDINRFKQPQDAFDATKFGVQQSTYDMLVKRYGEKTAQAQLQRSSDATGINNMDGFVISEAKKNYKPLTAAQSKAETDAKLIDTETPVAKEGVKIVSKNGSDITQNLAATERAIKVAKKEGDAETVQNLQMKQLADLEDSKQVALNQEVVQTPAQVVGQSTAKLPDSVSATADDIPNIEKTMEDTQAHIHNFGESTTPEARTKMMQEIAQHDRDGSPISAESKAMYDEYVKPVVDAMYGKSKRSQEGNLGKKDYYLPEEKIGTEAKTFSPFGRGWIDDANLEFGHASRREGKIDTAELNDPMKALQNYTEQFYNDNYGHLSPENMAEAKLRNVGNAVDYIKGRQELAEKVDKSLVREVSLNVGNTKQKLQGAKDMVGDIQRNFDKNGGDPATVVTIDAKLPAAAAARTNRKISQRIKAGINEDAYTEFGMRQYENATPNGNEAFKQTFDPNSDDLPEYAANLRGYYEDVFNRDFNKVMSKTKFDDMVDSAAIRSFEDQSPMAIHKLERNLAIEKAIYSSEHIRYSDKKTAAQINREVTHMLRDGKMPQTIARKVTDEFTKMTYSGALGLNPLSAVQNLTELSRVAGLTGGKDAIATLKSQMKDATIPKIRELLQDYGVNNSRIQQELQGSFQSPTGNPLKKGVKIADKGRDKVNEFVMAGFNATDAMKNYGMLKALEIKHAGIPDPRLRREAIMDDFNANALLGGHYGNIEATNRNNFTRAAMQFGSYTMRDWGQLAEMAKKGDWGYVSRTLGTRAGIALPMYALFGTTLAYTMGINEYKGGPIVSLGTNAMQAMGDEAKRVQDEIDKGNDATFDWSNVKDQTLKKQGALVLPGGNYLLNKLGVQDLFGATKDTSWLRHDTAIGDMQRGYNENKSGAPRFAAPQTPWSAFKSIIGGSYNSDEAGKYFNKSLITPPQLYGIFDTNNQKYVPVGKRYQEEIEAQSKLMQDPAATPEKKLEARGEIARLIDSAYGDQDLKNKFFTDNPDAANIYKQMTASTYNPETKKRESDVITPERWNFVSSDKTGTLFTFLKQRAERNNAEFGDPIDPIYQLTDKSKQNEVLALRAAFTGDDRERKEVLRKEKWFTDFEDAQKKYYEAKGSYAADPESIFGSTARAQQYFDLSQKNPAFDTPKSELMQQYEVYKNAGDEASRKAFYRNNADALGAEYEARSNQILNWTNQMRQIEGAEPIPADVWNNATYGYKDDEAALAKQLAAEYKAGYGSGFGNGSKGVSVANASFGSTGASPKVTIGKNVKANTVKVKSKLAKSKVSGVKVGKK